MSSLQHEYSIQSLTHKNAIHCTKNEVFPLRISSVNVIKFGNCGNCEKWKLWIGSHLLKKSLMENFIFFAVNSSMNTISFRTVMPCTIW